VNLRLYGPKHEKLSADQKELLPLEISLQEAEVEQEAERPQAQKQNLLPRAQKRQKAHAGREPLPAHLERREELIPCCPEDCRCEQCGAERPVIGYEVREELACEPAKYWVRVVKREKRGSHCLDEQGVATAAVPMQIVPKSKLSNELVIEVLVQKYQQHQPIYRQCAALAQEYGIELNAKTLGNAVLGAGELLEAVVRAQAQQLKAGAYLQADETTVQVQTAERTGKNHRAYMWQYSQPGGPVVFDFQMRRSRAGPREFLGGFRGKLQSDGYAAYADVGEGIMHVGCMAHARRGFVEANKLAPQDPLPQEVVQRIGKLYAVESEARAAGMSAGQRRQLRQQKSVPVMAALKTRLVEIRQGLSPGGKLARACDYMLGQWSRLEEYLADGSLEIDNNWCEGAMRPLALGRKNWLHIGSEATGPKVAAIASIVETCRRLKINLRAYLKDVLPRLGDWPSHRVLELTPAAWKAAQKI
jgi:transposase